MMMERVLDPKSLDPISWVEVRLAAMARVVTKFKLVGAPWAEGLIGTMA